MYIRRSAYQLHPNSQRNSALAVLIFGTRTFQHPFFVPIWFAGSSLLFLCDKLLEISGRMCMCNCQQWVCVHLCVLSRIPIIWKENNKKRQWKSFLFDEISRKVNYFVSFQNSDRFRFQEKLIEDSYSAFGRDCLEEFLTTCWRIRFWGFVLLFLIGNRKCTYLLGFCFNRRDFHW